MRETSFIKQNKEKWKEFEQTLDRKDTDPDKLNNLFIQITDDLSYSRTFYPNRSVRVYLNNLAQQIFYQIYKNKRTQLGRLTGFWTDELPRLVYEAKSEFQLSLFIFAISFAIGALSSAMDPEFPAVILGDNYVEMTLENIESGDPMAVYKQRGEFGMALGITANNLFVAFLTFILGVFYGVGTAAIMVSNGIMVGAFQYFFLEQGVFLESFLTIWIHGTLEISAIIIAGAAGLTMGKGLVFPGTLTRIQAFQISARRGLKIMVGIAPLIIAAGIIEGYLTRYTDTPDVIRALFIFLCLSFVLLYFVWYPMQLARRGFRSPVLDTQLPPDRQQAVDFSQIKNSGEIFADIFLVYRKHFGAFMLWSFSAAGLYCLAAFLTADELPAALFLFQGELFSSIRNFPQFFFHQDIPLLPVINMVLIGLSAYVSFSLLHKSHPDKANRSFTNRERIIDFIKMLMVGGATLLLTLPSNLYIILGFLIVLPSILLWGYIQFEERLGPLAAIRRMFHLISGQYERSFDLFFNYDQQLGLSFILLSLGLLFYNIMDSFLFWFYIDLISWNLTLDQAALDQLGAVLLTFFSMTAIHMIFSLLLLGTGLLYHSLLEIKEAPSLQRRIEQIGQTQRIQGLEKEN
ncbi:MAG: stage II sporulation protein M [Bacteroidota bacterium]